MVTVVTVVTHTFLSSSGADFRRYHLRYHLPDLLVTVVTPNQYERSHTLLALA